MNMRAWLKRTGIAILIPIVFFLLAAGLLFVPAVQNAVVRKVMTQVSASTGWDIGFERLRLSFPLDFAVHSVIVAGADNDTLLYLKKLTADVRLRPLLNGRLSVKGLMLESLELNTGNLLEGLILSGNVGKAFLRADSVNLKEEQAWINRIVMSDADLHLFYCDTTVADTAATGTNWRFNLKKVELNNVAFTCLLPCDSVYLNLDFYKAALSDGVVDLGADLYRSSAFHAQMNELYYGTELNGAVRSGMDFLPVRLTELRLVADSLYYEGGDNISLVIRECAAKEESGLVVKSAAGHVEMDSLQLKIPDLRIETPFSTVLLQAIVPWSSIDDKQPKEQLSLNAKAHVHKNDLLLLLGEQSDDFQSWYPEMMLALEATATGNLKDMTLQKLDAELSGAFNFHLTGSVVSLNDAPHRTGRFDYSVTTQNMDFITGMLPQTWRQRFRMPEDMSLNGYLTIEKDLFATRMLWKEGSGRVRFSGNYNTSTESYNAFLKIDSLEPVHFLPDDSLRWIDAFIRAKGRGTDIYRSDTQLEMEGRINQLQYGSLSLSDDISFSAKLDCQQLQAALESKMPLAKGSVSLDGDLLEKGLRGTVVIDVDSFDVHGLKMSDSPLSTAFQLFSEFETDFEKQHKIDVTAGNWRLNFENQTVTPKMLTFAFNSSPDTTRASLHAGDMHVALTGNSDVESLADRFVQLTKMTAEQLKHDTVFSLEAIRPFFPELSVQINAGHDNPVYDYLLEHNTFFDHFHLEASISPDDGLTVDATLLSLVKDTFKIDTVRFNAWQDTSGVQYAASITKNRFRNQASFKTDVNGFIRNNEADVFASFVNSKGEKGLYLGVNAKKAADGFDFHFYPAQSVIAFLPFTINEDNYFRYVNKNEMEADLRLGGNDHSSIWIHSAHEEEAMKAMMIEINQINLQEISDGFSVLPSLRGMLNITFKYEPEEHSFFVIADGNIDDLYFENGRIGELLLNATYLPVEKGVHQVDLHAFHDMAEIASLSVTYQEGKTESKIDGFISVERFPLAIANAMIPDQTVQLNGRLNGKFDVSGTDASPLLSGTIKIDSGTAFIAPVATTLHIDDQPVRMTNNKIHADKFKIYAQKENPFVIDGIIDATNTSLPVVDLSMTASNMQLLDMRKTPGSIAFGRLFVNVNSTLSGSLEALRMRGNVHIPGNTNMTYVMADADLEIQDNFSNLVTFTYLADTLPRRTGRRLNLSRNITAVGTDALMNISIDPVVRLRIALDEAQANYVDLRGGGNLSIHYTTQGELLMNGRYTLSDGTIRYAIPVIPLTDFTIRNGSYVDWSGDPMNPYLNISAYSRIRSSVNFGGQSRMVNFNAGIQLKDNLDDVSVQFLLEAPTDAVIQNHLASMGAEARSMQAISLLMTGVYLANEGVTGNYNVNVSAALNTLLQREIKNILGSLMGDVPVSFDVNTYDGTEGMGRRIDYIGRFYKDFFNERFNTTLGVRYTTQDPENGNSFFPDDISFGYRLDTDGSRAVHLFRSREYENTFENEITKFGASFTIRRKIKRLCELFAFGKRVAVPTKGNDDEEEADDE